MPEGNLRTPRTPRLLRLAPKFWPRSGHKTLRERWPFYRRSGDNACFLPVAAVAVAAGPSSIANRSSHRSWIFRLAIESALAHWFRFHLPDARAVAPSVFQPDPVPELLY